MTGKIKLYGFVGSNAVYTGRLMLEHKGLDYDFVKLPPAAHAMILLARGFPTTGAPAMKIDGLKVQGTRWIARALDEHHPANPLFPPDAGARRAVEHAERWGEELQNATRRIFYCAGRRDRDAFMSVLGAGRGLVKRTTIRMFAPVIMKLATGVHRATDDAAREDIELLPERLDQIDAWIEEGLLNGPELNAADFQIAVNVSAMLLSVDLAPFIEGRPAAQLARRVAPDYQGHLGPVVPDAWMTALRAASGTAIPAQHAGAGGAPATTANAVRRTASLDDARVAALLQLERT